MPDHGQHRSTQRHRPRRGGGATTRCGSGCGRSRAEHPRWGYRRAWGAVREEGWAVNRKKIQRLWREEGLRVPQRNGASGCGSATRPCPPARLRAERPNHVWALDFQFDTTSDGRTLKLLHVVDEHTREALGDRVARSIDADRTVARARPDRRRARPLARARAHGQRPRADRQRPARLVSLRRAPARSLHRARLALGEPVRRVLRLHASATRCSPSKRSTRCSKRKTVIEDWKNHLQPP